LALRLPPFLSLISSCCNDCYQCMRLIALAQHPVQHHVLYNSKPQSRLCDRVARPRDTFIHSPALRLSLWFRSCCEVCRSITGGSQPNPGCSASPAALHQMLQHQPGGTISSSSITS
jgi:hypothetical protein